MRKGAAQAVPLFVAIVALSGLQQSFPALLAVGQPRESSTWCRRDGPRCGKWPRAISSIRNRRVASSSFLETGGHLVRMASERRKRMRGT